MTIKNNETFRARKDGDLIGSRQDEPKPTLSDLSCRVVSFCKGLFGVLCSAINDTQTLRRSARGAAACACNITAGIPRAEYEKLAASASPPPA